MKCRKHPRYNAIRKPVRTKVNSTGCPYCWVIYCSKMANTLPITEKMKKLFPNF